MKALKTISLAIAIGIGATKIFAQPQKQTTTKANLQGNPEYVVHLVAKATMQEDGSVAQGQTLRTFEYTYYPNGNLKEMKNITSTGKIRYIYQYNYDTNNNETIRTELDDSKQIVQNRICNYENNRMSSLFVYNKDNQIETKNIYSYNIDGFIEKELCYQKEELVKTIVYQRDENGNMLLQSDIFPDSNTIKIRICRYNQQNQMIEDIKNDKHEEMIYHNINKYDSQGLLIEQNYQKISGELSKKVVFTYDNHHNLLSETWYDINNNAFYFNKYTYQYDEQGNWIVKISYHGKDETLVQIETRAISYF